MATELELEKGFAIGDNVEITTIGGAAKYYTITGRDIIIYPYDAPTISPGSTLSYTEISDLDPPTGQLYQIYKIKLEKGNVKVYMKQPAAVNRWGTNKVPEVYLNDRFDEVLIDMFILEDYPPNVQIKNETNVSIAPRLRFFGWRYTIKEIPKPVTYTKIRIGGLSE